MSEKDLIEAFTIVAPVAKMCGVSEEDTKKVLKYFDDMENRGVNPKTASMALRRTILDLNEPKSMKITKKVAKELFNVPVDGMGTDWFIRDGIKVEIIDK